MVNNRNEQNNLDQKIQSPKKVEQKRVSAFNISKWFSNLMGKPSTGAKENVPQDNKVPSTTSSAELSDKTQSASTPELMPVGDDSVKEDFKKAKQIISSLVGKASEKSAPFVTSGKEKTGAAMKEVGKVVDVSFMRKLVRGLMVLLFLFVAGVLIFRFYKLTQQNGIEEVPGNTPSVTVTYIPYKESIYSADPDVIRLEESINTLKREVLNTKIKITTFNPPVLDFSISF